MLSACCVYVGHKPPQLTFLFMWEGNVAAVSHEVQLFLVETTDPCRFMYIRIYSNEKA